MRSYAYSARERVPTQAGAGAGREPSGRELESYREVDGEENLAG